MNAGLVVTGAAGWFGQALLGRLASQPPPVEEVRTLVSRPTDVALVERALPGAQIFVGDVRSQADVADLFDGLDDVVLVHAAAVIHPRKMADFQTVNVAGTRRVLEAAIAHGLSRMVYLSSNSAIGTNPSPDEAFADNEPYQPYLGYGASKMQAELEVRELLGDAGIPGTILRPPWFYGPFQPDRQARFLKTVRLGRFPLLGDGRNKRSMVYVDDLAQATSSAIMSTAAGVRSYWVADAEPYSMAEIVAAVREAARREGLPVAGRIKHLPGSTAVLAERVDRLLQRSGRYLSEVHVAGELDKTIACRITGARHDLGYRPTVGLLEGMRRSYRWGLAHGQDV